jgi:hypothetical protein
VANTVTLGGKMSDFLPEVIAPNPDPWFVKELKKIDPNLRVVFGYQQYLTKKWAIERKFTPEQYHNAYKSQLDAGGPRFVEQPVYDSNQPILDMGQIVGYKQIGVRQFDIMPEWQWIQFVDRLDEEFLTQIRRSYAWERNHPISRMKFEQDQAMAAQQKKDKDKRNELVREGVEEAFRALRKKVVFGAGASRSENNVL